MAVRVSGVGINYPALAGSFLRRRKVPSSSSTTFLAASTSTSASSAPTIQIVGGRTPSWYDNGNLQSSSMYEEEFDWLDLEAVLHRWTKALRPVQMESWLGNRNRILVLNREEMMSIADRNAWAAYYSKQGTKVIFPNGKLGMGTIKLRRLAKTLSTGVNVKRRARGLLPRPVRAGIIGYPNVGKSSVINRLLKHRMCPAAPRPCVTRTLKWVHFGKDLELLDFPGIIPMKISVSTIKLAICDDIGERSYDLTAVAAILVQILTRLPEAGNKDLCNRYKIDEDSSCGKTHVSSVIAECKCLNKMSSLAFTGTVSMHLRLDLSQVSSQILINLSLIADSCTSWQLTCSMGM